STGDSAAFVGDPSVIRRPDDRAVRLRMWPIEGAVDPRPRIRNSAMTIAQTPSRKGPSASANTPAHGPDNAGGANCQPSRQPMKADPMNRIVTTLSALAIAAALVAPAQAAGI